MLWRQVKAKVLARSGEEHARRSGWPIRGGICAKTDLLNDLASVYADLTEVLFVGRTEGAVEALEQALARYERKENLLWPSAPEHVRRNCRHELPRSGPNPACSANHHVGHKSMD